MLKLVIVCISFGGCDSVCVIVGLKFFVLWMLISCGLGWWFLNVIIGLLVSRNLFSVEDVFEYIMFICGNRLRMLLFLVKCRCLFFSVLYLVWVFGFIFGWKVMI